MITISEFDPDLLFQPELLVMSYNYVESYDRCRDVGIVWITVLHRLLRNMKN